MLSLRCLVAVQYFTVSNVETRFCCVVYNRIMAICPLYDTVADSSASADLLTELWMTVD